MAYGTFTTALSLDLSHMFFAFSVRNEHQYEIYSSNTGNEADAWLSLYATFICARFIPYMQDCFFLTLSNVRWENKYRHLNSLNSNFSASERESVSLKTGKNLCRWFNILKVTRLSLCTGNEKWDVHYREGINNLIICENDLWDSFYANVRHT